MTINVEEKDSERFQFERPKVWGSSGISIHMRWCDHIKGWCSTPESYHEDGNLTGYRQCKSCSVAH